jgi:hypothetical protein
MKIESWFVMNASHTMYVTIKTGMFWTKQTQILKTALQRSTTQSNKALPFSRL